MEMRRRALLLITTMTLTLVAASGTAFAVLKIGTDGPDTLIGTHSTDQITGKGSNDTLKGLAGDDIYYFDDGWAQDTLDEPATQTVPVRVRKKGRWRTAWSTISGGSDTLSFSSVDTGLLVLLVRQWGPTNHQASDYSTNNVVNLGASVVENATGGRGEDLIQAGAESNTLQPGGGASDVLVDVGGWTDVGGNPDLPVSNDVFKGFEFNSGTDRVTDWGGTADVVDMRPFSSSNVYVSSVDLENNGTQESLQIVTSPTAQVIIEGHFSEYADYTSRYGQQGRIESLVFSDGTFSGISSSTASISSEGASTDTVEKLISTSKEQAKTISEGVELERAARKLLEKAQQELAAAPVLPAEGT